MYWRTDKTFLSYTSLSLLRSLSFVSPSIGRLFAATATQISAQTTADAGRRVLNPGIEYEAEVLAAETVSYEVKGMVDGAQKIWNDSIETTEHIQIRIVSQLDDLENVCQRGERAANGGHNDHHQNHPCHRYNGSCLSIVPESLLPVAGSVICRNPIRSFSALSIRFISSCNFYSRWRCHC